MVDEPNPNQNPNPGPNAPPAIDWAAVAGTLSPANKEIFERKGFHKSGANGGPADVNVLMDTLRHQETLIGKNNLAQPNLLDANELNGWAGWKALGVPEKADGYKGAFKRAAMPNGADGKPIAYDEKMEGVFLEAAREMGVSPARLQKGYDILMAAQVANASAFQQELSNDKIETEAEVNRLYGANRKLVLDRARNTANQLAEKIGINPEVLKQDLNERFGSVGVIKLMDYLSQHLGEDVIVPADGRPGDISTPAGARATIKAKEADPMFMKALRDPADPGHAEAVNLRRKLYEIAGQAN